MKHHFPRSLLLAAVLGASAVSASAATGEAPALRTDVPGSYTVRSGDTLWDISGRFLRDPWRWPDVWRGNPQIRNPHLIYPGDEVYLTRVEGKPQLRLRRGRGGTVKLSPNVRSSPLDTAVTTVPLEVIDPFLVRPVIVSEDEYDSAPYIVSVGRETVIATAGSRIYARGIGDVSVTRFGIFRRGRAYVDPDQGGEIIGFETLRVAEALLDEAGDPARLVVTRPTREVLVGDRLLPLGASELATRFEPRSPPGDSRGRVISLVDAVSQVGRYQIVVLNLGSEAGVESGMVYRVTTDEREIFDPATRALPRPADDNERVPVELDPARQGGLEGFAQAFNRAGSSLGDRVVRIASGLAGQGDSRATVTLPEEPVGLVMVVQPFERLSFALVMESYGAIRVNDRVRSPDE